MSPITDLDRPVTPDAPRMVAFYSGDNDHAGISGPVPMMTEAETAYAQPLAACRARLPAAQLVVVFIKPSPRRQAMWSLVREANARLRALTQVVDGAPCLDLASGLLDRSDSARPTLFRRDQLHLDAAGYGIRRETHTG